MIVLAREARGLSQQDLAEKLNLVHETKPLSDETITDRQSRISEIEQLSDAEAEVLLRSRLENLQPGSPSIFDR